LNHYPLLFYKRDIPSNVKSLWVAGDKFMNTGVCKRLDAQSWKDLYQAAMCEADVNKLPERIAEAETALAMRARELFYTSGDRFEEEESLDDAMCVLRALRSSLKRRPSAIQGTGNSDYSRSA
jgi:hypothetical protein